MNQITINQALINIGDALAHPSLKLSQKEHLVLLDSYETIKKELEKVEVKKDP